MAQKYYLPGYTPPPGISDSNRVKEVQRALGITVDGVWGPQTDLAYKTSRNASAALTNASKKYGTTFGNLGYRPSVITTTVTTPLKKTNKPSIQNTGMTVEQMQAAYAALTQASRTHNTTYGNPGFVKPEEKTAEAPAVQADPQAQLMRFINVSFLSDRDKRRAAYTIEDMDMEDLTDLLGKVKKYGVLKFFSQEAFENGAIEMILGKSEEEAVEALTDVSKEYGRTFGNPGYSSKTAAMRNLEPYFSPEKMMLERLRIRL